MTIAENVAAWVERAREKLENGGISGADLEELRRAAGEPGRRVRRQRLLYLHAATPSIRSQVIGMALHEPIRGSVTQITTEPQEWPYATVHDAILDGWQVIHFPDQRAPFDDREIDILGYEFILQQWGEYDLDR
jgi:hypothetical protein